MIFKLELGHNAVEAAKNICCVKGEGTVDHITVTSWLKKFHSGCKNFDDQAKLEAMLQAIKVNLGSSTWKVSGELGILLSSVVHHFYNFDKSIQSCWIVPHIIKIL